jgi:uncharacterized membrane protein YkgB
MATDARPIDLEAKAGKSLPAPARRLFERVDGAVTGALDRYGITALRIALGIVFIWFGALKIIDRSPVEDLVASTIYWLPQEEAMVRVLGAWEVVVGLGLLVPVALRLTLLLFWAQMAGTFLVLVLQPDLSFQGNNPLLLTTEGEFVIKNLVLIAAGLAVGSTLRRRTAASAQR